MATRSYRDAPTRWIDVGGTRFSYRRLGPSATPPVIFLNHLSAVLDNWDPRVVDGIAATRDVIVFNNRGVGSSEGRTPRSVEEMATDAVAFIRALGLSQVDLLGFSLGGFVSQVLARRAPDLIRKVVLAGTGPAGGVGIDEVTPITVLDMIRGGLTRRDPKHYLFFTSTANGQAAARSFLQRLHERTEDRDAPVSITAFRNQLAAIRRWGKQEPWDLSTIQHPVFVANGEHDRMVPTSNTTALARRLPNATVSIYPDAGHGGIFQHHDRFVREVLEFLGP
ncbi:alpha/beta hydrolase [Saccharopolyspora sp. NFXS83]|uniref:alpha/beta fold hydrolase n=1 Tax=Saccharopolyspora sp. NFXS83 TaxID=2993560 RepID=UPI00224B1410|nr:alpha/beta hydrolase [Saccharopolyspora sp. NFXS83]MCX2729911.1 alpha/beta hydrolase [Saccharopolyspora sp. NFXS83]